MPITTVFFDLGDTLWHLPNLPPPDVIRNETMRRIGVLIQSWGYDMNVGDRNMIGRDIRLTINEEIHTAFHGDAVEPDYTGICQRIAAAHDIVIDEKRARELWNTWNLGGVFLGRALYPDVLDTLNELLRRGYRLGSITNRGYGGPLFWEEIDHLGLRDLFEHIAVSCELGYMKPHPNIYHYACDKLSVEPEECLMVGDNLRADVEGAKTVGMQAAWRRNLRPDPVEATEDQPEFTGPIAPDYTISQIGELLDHLPSRS